MKKVVLHAAILKVRQVFFQLKFLPLIKQGVADGAFDGLAVHQHIIFFPVGGIDPLIRVGVKGIAVIGSLAKGESQFRPDIVIGRVMEGIFRCDLARISQICRFLSVIFLRKFL